MSLSIQTDPVDIYNQILLERSGGHRGAFFIVEGPGDEAALKRFVDPTCSIIIAKGKDNVLGVIALCANKGFDAACCLVDADWDRLNGITHTTGSVFVTDHHDLDLTIASTDTLEAYLSTVQDLEKRQALVSNRAASLREIMLMAIEPIGRLRWLNDRNGWRLRFRDLPYDFICRDTLVCNATRMVDEVHGQSPNARISRQDLLIAIMNQAPQHDKLWDICNGHDFAATVVIALQAAVGNDGKEPVHYRRRKDVETALRAVFAPEHFDSTKLRSRLAEWSVPTQPHRKLLR